MPTTHSRLGALPRQPISELPSLRTSCCYSIGRILGKGSFGVVSLATDSTTGAEVAIKHISAAIRHDHPDMLRIEVEHQQQLHHPHVLAIQEVIEICYDAFIVTEYLCGGNLHEYMAGFDPSPLPEGDARRLFRQLIAGVAHIHHHNISHRDLALKNILVDGAGNLKICDFGVSAKMTAKPFSTCVGTVAYMAPEMLPTKCMYYGDEADIFSCGVILYVLLCNRYPFGHLIGKCARVASKGEYDMLMHGQVSFDAKHLISHMLCVNPIRRYLVPEVIRCAWFENDSLSYTSDIGTPSLIIGCTKDEPVCAGGRQFIIGHRKRMTRHGILMFANDSAIGEKVVIECISKFNHTHRVRTAIKQGTPLHHGASHQDVGDIQGISETDDALFIIMGYVDSSRRRVPQFCKDWKQRNRQVKCEKEAKRLYDCDIERSPCSA